MAYSSLLERPPYCCSMPFGSHIFITKEDLLFVSPGKFMRQLRWVFFVFYPLSGPIIQK